MRQVRKPRWWQLDSLMLTMMAVLFWISRAGLPMVREQLLQITVIILGFVLVGFWLYTNADALEAEEQRRRTEVRQPWHPHWWRPGLNGRQRHYLAITHRASRQISKEQ